MQPVPVPVARPQAAPQPAPRTARPPRGRSWLPAAALAAALAAGVPACSKREQPAAAGPPGVLTIRAPHRAVPVIRSWTGVLEGSANVEVRPRVSGYLLERKYQEGMPVKQGDVLFLIDPRPFEAALRQAEAARSQAEAQQVKARQDEARFAELVQRNAVSRQDYEHAVQAHLAANADVAAAQAVVDQAQLDLGFCTVTSEADGIAGFANYERGDLVGPSNEKPLTIVSAVDPIKVSFQISEQEYLAARRSQELDAARKAGAEMPLKLILADRTEHPHPGTKSSFSREVNPQTGTFEVTAFFSNPGNILRPGQFARVEAVLTTIDAVVVPQRALLETQGVYQVAVVGGDGRVEVRPVTVGPATGSERAITAGLAEGETVVVEGLQKLKSGIQVATAPWQPPANEPAKEPAKDPAKEPAKEPPKGAAKEPPKDAAAGPGPAAQPQPEAQ